MKFVYTVLVTVLFCGMGFSQTRQKKKANAATNEWRYELECMGVGTQGTYLVKVWSYSKNPKIAIEQAKKNAVHGIVFKGFSGTGQMCPSQKALAPQVGVEEQFKSFFERFFADNGNYMKYVSVSSDGGVGAQDIVKIGKEYKIGIVVSVMKDALRKDLETAGVIKGLNSGF